MIEINEISPSTADEYITSGALLIDVREKEEVQQIAFDIAGIRNTSYSIFDENYMDIPKNQKLVIACHLGIRSVRVAQFLVVQGWDPNNIYSLEGGIDAWQRDKFPVKIAPRTFSMAKAESTGCCGSSSYGSCCN